MIFEAPLRRGFITPFFMTISQNSKSKENWIWRRPVPAMGSDPSNGVKLSRTQILIWERELLNKLKIQLQSRRFTPPTGILQDASPSLYVPDRFFREFRKSGRAGRGAVGGEAPGSSQGPSRIHRPATLQCSESCDFNMSERCVSSRCLLRLIRHFSLRHPIGNSHSAAQSVAG